MCANAFSSFRGTKKCTNKTLCEENLNVLLPAKPPFHPRQFPTCAVVGNSGDLLKTTFGKEIDSHDAVFRDNEAPVNEVNMSTHHSGGKVLTISSFISVFLKSC